MASCFDSLDDMALLGLGLLLEEESVPKEAARFLVELSPFLEEGVDLCQH